MDTGAATTSESRRYRWPRPSEPCDPCLSVLILRFVVPLATTRGHTFERLQLPKPDLDRLGRGSAPPRTGRHIAPHDADRCDLGALADGHVIGHANACAQDDEVLQRGTPGNPGLSNEHTVPSNHHIVANLNEIVDLGTLADHGVADRPAVDGGARPAVSPSSPRGARTPLIPNPPTGGQGLTMSYREVPALRENPQTARSLS